jgi:hypothetical protein
MRTDWAELVGSKVGGGYLLRELIGSTDRSGVYRTFHGEGAAVLKLVYSDEEPASKPEFEYRQVIRLYASGHYEMDGSVFHYFVMEAADENLASVIAARALSPDETREMLVPLLDALSYLHEHGLAHGRIRPSNILAVGDSIKLSADSVRPVGAVASPEEDMRALGLTIIEVLTQERQASGIANVPQPMRDIVEHALEPDPALRWSARQAAMRLSGSVMSAPVSAPEPEVGAPVVPLAEAPKSPLHFWLLPAVVVVMALAVIYVLARGTGSSSDSFAASIPAASAPSTGVPSSDNLSNTRSRSSQAGNAPVPGSQNVGPPDAVMRRQTAPVLPKPTPFEPASRPAAKVGGSGWFVVVASYAREADAAQEAGALNRRFPQFKLAVFPPSAIDTHYLVIVGSGLSEERAEALRQRAVASGLPPDTYIKKYPAPRS